MNNITNPDIWFPNLGIKINSLSNIAFSIAGFPLYFYGIFIGLGVVAGSVYATYNAKRTGQNPDYYSDFIPFALIFSMIGARLYYVAFTWQNYKNDLIRIFALREGGLAIYGAVIASFITAVVYAKVRKINLSKFIDTATPALVLGQVIGRWGNFFNREAFGGYTDGIFAMRYRINGMFSIPDQLMNNLIDVDGASYIQVHPTFLYESVWNLLVFIFLHIYTKKKKFDSEIFALYLLFYGLGRAWIEGLRTDQLLIGGTNLAASQVLSIALFIGALVYLIIKRGAKSRSIAGREAEAYVSPFGGARFGDDPSLKSSVAKPDESSGGDLFVN